MDHAARIHAVLIRDVEMYLEDLNAAAHRDALVIHEMAVFAEITQLIFVLGNHVVVMLPAGSSIRMNRSAIALPNTRTVIHTMNVSSFCEKTISKTSSHYFY